MANIKSAKKRARQAITRRAHNMSRRSMLRTAIKRVLEAVEKGDGALASSAFVAASSILDKSLKSGLIHKNKAARHKSQLAKKLKAIGAPSLLKAEESVKIVKAKAEKKSAKKPSEKKKSEKKKEGKAEKPAVKKQASSTKAKGQSKKAEAEKTED